MAEERLRNIGIFAHVDAGKTTTTEQMLFKSGQLRALGSVDSGTAQTDWLDVERERGISVRAAVTRLVWRDAAINLVDTPGHVDFLSEVERSLRVLDGAVLIVSAAEGVQAQTEVIWQALRELNIPTLIYTNKMDRIGADAVTVLAQIRRLLSAQAVPISAPDGQEAAYRGAADLLSGEPNAAWAAEFAEQLMEALAELDDAAMERYLEHGVLTSEQMLPLVQQGTAACKLFPVLFGASGRGIGVEALMDAIVKLLPEAEGAAEKALSGIVFKIERDPAMGRVAFVRLYNGMLRNRDTVWNATAELEEKVTQIRRILGQKTEDIGIVRAGDIAAVYGLNQARIGDIIGSPDGIPGGKTLAVPLLTVQAHWQNAAEYPAVVAAFQELADEDPLLDVQWLADERELHLKVMGPIQLEVLTRLVQTRYGLEVSFGKPSVIYKETPASAGEGYIAYTMPKPCWAVLRFLIEPGEPGSGLQYRSVVRREDLLDSYQNEVARRVPEALQQGLKGWEVTDLRVTLVAGEHHVWHTHPLDFVVATPMGIMDGLAKTGTRLLEPMLRFRLSVPEEFSGKLMNELLLMRSEFDAPLVGQERVEIEGRLPVATSLDFPARLGSLTKGRGTLSVFFDGYQACPADVEAERQRRGVDPRDQAKYILAVRKALSNG
ncbi:GTP-binding protein [Paenibacillus sp. GCM10027626]|uniref:GTP-binding protein n=1 Tax=Paenibacillus sp. GCM10027626 TaxID=3273411 RepID=UPI0036316443